MSYAFEYIVSTLDGEASLTDNQLFLRQTFSLGNVESIQGFFSIVEEIFADDNLLGSKEISEIFLDGDRTTVSTDALSFDPQSSLLVKTVITLTSEVGEFGVVSFGETFPFPSSLVPEASTLALVSLGLGGLGFARSRRPRS